MQISCIINEVTKVKFGQHLRIWLHIFLCQLNIIYLFTNFWVIFISYDLAIFKSHFFMFTMVEFSRSKVKNWNKVINLCQISPFHIEISPNLIHSRLKMTHPKAYFRNDFNDISLIWFGLQVFKLCQIEVKMF